MTVRTIKTSLTLIVMLLTIRFSSSTTVISGVVPENRDFFTLTAVQDLTVTITWNDPNSKLFATITPSSGVALTCGSNPPLTSPATCTFPNLAAGIYQSLVLINSGFFNPLLPLVKYNYVIRTNTRVILSDTEIASVNPQISFASQVSLPIACEAQVQYNGPSGIIAFFPANVISTSPTEIIFASSIQTITIPRSGNYVMVIAANTLPKTPFTLTITTNCKCGDAILSNNQQCDNGNKTGCSTGCKVDYGYECSGQIGTTSYCQKVVICGDGIVDQGQQCDNINKPGCSNNCIIDTGFNCSAIIGQPSVCSFCGNGIIQLNEQCDNFNQVGCSQNCRVDPGYTCRNISPSICSQNNPACGNGIIEIGEGCDDSNLINGDGCNAFCNIQSGFRCLGALGQLSNCVRTQTTIPVCGNGIYEPVPVPANTFSTPIFGLNYPGFIEQCDNGNKDGCYGCVIQGGWQCSSIVGQRSICSPLVTIPTCGNGIYEPNLGEVCDDGNILNGDGCNNRCQVEYGWICPDNVRCFIPSTSPPPQTAIFCGNGVTQSPNEECDDGFPLKNGDGCNINCKVEAGWTCNNQGVSRCARI